MHGTEPAKRSTRARLRIVAGTVAAALALGIGGLHLPSVRRLALRVIVNRLERAGIVARAGQFDYNLATLRFHLSDLVLATQSTADKPFIAVKDVRVTLGWTTLLGRIVLNDLTLDEPRVELIRTTDGTTNWPAASSHPASLARRILIEHARVNDLTFRWQDPQSSADIGVSFELNGADPVARIVATRPGRIAWRNHRSTLQTINGRLGWNGADLSVAELLLRLPEGTMTAGGRIEQVGGEPRLDMHVVADTELRAVAPWFDQTRAVSGSTRVDARLTGPLSSPDLTMALSGHDVAISGVPPASIDATVHATHEKGALESLRARLAGGSISADGQAAFDGPGVLRVAWQGVDLGVLSGEALRGALPNASIPPSARLSGSLDARWTVPRLDAVELRADTHAAHDSGAATGGLPVDGSATFALRAREWRLKTSDIRTSGARVRVEVGGALNVNRPTGSTIEGLVDVKADDAGQLAAALTQARLIKTTAPISGSATARFDVRGNVDAPLLHGPLDATVSYPLLPDTQLGAQVSIAPEGARAQEIDVRLGASSARGEVGWSRGSDALHGGLNASLALADLAGLSSSLPKTLPLDGRIELSASLGGTLSHGQVKAAASSVGLDAAGQHIDRATAEISADLNAARFSIERFALQSDHGRIEGRGGADLTQQTYTAHLTAADIPVRPIVGMGTDSDVPISARLNGAFDGEGSFTNLDGRGRVALSGTRWKDLDLGNVNAEVTLAGRDASVVADAPDLALKAIGSVGVDPRGALAFRGEWAPNDVGSIAQRLARATSPAISGSARIRFELNGSRDRLDQLHSLAALDALDLVVSGQTILLARPGRIEYDGRTARAGNVALATGTTTLVIDGSTGDQAPRGLTASLDGSLADFAFVRELIKPRAMGAPPVPSPSGLIRLRLSATGTVARPDVSGTVQITDGRMPMTTGQRVTSIGLSATFGEGVVTVDSATASFEGASLTASARMPSNVFVDRLPQFLRSRITRVDGPAALTARLQSVTPAVVAPFVDPQTLGQLGGRIDATVQLEADRAALDRVRGTAVLDHVDLTMAGIPFDQQMPTRLAVRDGRLSVDAWEWGRDDNRLAVRGSATLSGDPSLDLVATAVLDLRVLNILSPAARVLGRADSEVHLTGSVKAPTLDGWVTVSNGEARIANPRLVVSDVTGTITLAADTLTVQRIFASVNGGDSEISGTLRHRWFSPLGGRITMVTSGASVAIEGLRAEANANIALDAEPGRPVVNGTVTLVRSAFREPLSLTSGLLRALQAPSSSPLPAAPSALDRLRLDVRVLTENDLLIDNNYGKLSASADLRLVGTATHPSITGRATLGEGGSIFFGTRRYRLREGGSIDFANPNRIEPDLNLSAVARVQNTDITLTLTGTPATLETRLTSDDPQYTQSDLVSLLLVGQTASAATAGGISSSGTELLGLLSGEFLNAAGQVVGLSTLRVESGAPDVRFDAGLVATETDPGTRLTIGRNIGSRFEVVFSQSLHQSGGLTWILSYSPRSNLNLRVVNLDSGDRIYDFRHDLTFGRPANATRAAPGLRQTVSSVRITGAGADESALARRLKLKDGDRFSFFQWQDDREQIERYFHERDRFEAHVVTKRVPEPAGSTVIGLAYDVRPGPRTAVEAQGFALSAATLQDIERAWTGAVVDELLVEEVVRLVRAALVDAGYVQASVTTRIQKALDEKRLVIRIEAGTRAASKAVRFTGNKGEPTKRLQTVLSDDRLAPAVWIEPETARDTLVAFYRAEGYLKAAVRLDPIVWEQGTAIRPIQIDEGDPFRIQDIQVEGGGALSAADVIAKAGLSKGEVVTESKMEHARIALDQAYRALGYNSVDVTLQSGPHIDRPEVDVSVRVDEGRQQKLRDVATMGVEHTHPSLVSRALKLNIGEPVNLSAWNDARRRLYETGAFRSVDIEREVIAEPVSEAAAASADAVEPVRALVTVQEWPRYRLRYGLELNDTAQSGDPSEVLPTFQEGGRTFSLGATSDFAARNLFGRAVTAGVAGRYTIDFRAARTYITMPTFMGRRITTTVFLERSHEETGVTATGIQPAFATDATTFTFEQRVRPFEKVEVQYGYSVERNHTFDIIPDPLFPVDAEFTKASLTSGVVIDRRNDLFDATAGWFHASTLEYAPDWLSPDLTLARLFVQQRYYRRQGPIVFATWAQLGLATGFDQVLIPSDRFFAGGGNSVRGYAEQVLSPRDFLGTIVGGNALLVLNQEIRFPMFKYVRGVGFIDAGRAFETVSQVSLRDLAVGTGIGFRVQTPVVLLRFDVGVPLDASYGPRRPRWFFSIGQMF
jgi:outer membrane protein assembly factor BamA/autotransporter translocation and assembly factor TamB